jgi:hypothetical protein
MEYQESSKNLNTTEEELSTDIDLAEEGALFSDETSEDALLPEPRPEKTKDKKQSHQRSLSVRRAIEEHLEEARLRKELDYLSIESLDKNKR